MTEFISMDGFIYKQIEAKFNEGGMKAVSEYVKFNLDSWKSATVSIAVTGGSGVGKSTFINACLDMDNDHPDAAKTGVKETTTEVECYMDPTNPNIKLFDLPGIGTTKFPKKEYLEKIQINRFDILLLMTATRFTENDAWLAEEIKKQKKPLCLVRTKVWDDIKNKNRKVRTKTPVKDILDEIRTDCHEHIKDKDVTIYLIDSFEENEERLDFMKLRAAVLEKLPEEKKNALLYAIRDFTMSSPNLIKEKGETLRARIWKASLVSGSVGLIPIPGVSLMVDLPIIHKEKNFFADQLGLAKDGFFHKITTGTESAMSATTVDVIRTVVEVWASELSEEMIKSLVVSEAAETVWMFIPIIGPFISGAISFIGTRRVLHKVLDKMIDDTIKLNTLIGSELAEGVEV